MSYHHFSICERAKIETFYNLGYSCRFIGKQLGRHYSSIARELYRRQGVGYKAEAGQQDYESKRQNSKPRGKWNKALARAVAEKLTATWSPEQIANTTTLGKLSFKTIYTWLYAGKIEGLSANVLRRKGKRRSCRNLAFYARGTSICNRPKEVYTRESFGHWELDTVVSGRKQSSGCLATFVERKTRLYTALMIPDRTAASMEKAITYLYNTLPKKAFQTATTDRGGEFACFENIKRRLGLTLYFADPYCPHQRGSNEYANGLLREFYPKNTDFAGITQEELTQKLLLINKRPRKCLQWRSPIQAFLHEVAHLN